MSGDPPGGTGRGNRANGAGGGRLPQLRWRRRRTRRLRWPRRTHLAWRSDPIIPNTGRDIGGLGGAPLAYTALTHLTMGGGGGAGQQNNNVGGAGSDGGGVVLIRGGRGRRAPARSKPTATTVKTPLAGSTMRRAALEQEASSSCAQQGSLSCGSAQAIGGEGGTAQFDDHGTGGGGAGGHTSAARGDHRVCAECQRRYSQVFKPILPTLPVCTTAHCRAS